MFVYDRLLSQLFRWIKSGEHIIVEVNGVPAHKISINDDTGTYVFHLPVGIIYDLDNCLTLLHIHRIVCDKVMRKHPDGAPHTEYPNYENRRR